MQVRVVVRNGGASRPKRPVLLIVPCEDNVLPPTALVGYGDDVAAPMCRSFHSPLVLPGDGVGHFLPRGSHVRAVAPRAVAVFLAAEENRWHCSVSSLNLNEVSGAGVRVMGGGTGRCSSSSISRR